MRASIAAPFADSRVTDLRLAYGLERLPALGTHHVAVPGGRIELRVLGASHQIVVDLDGARWSETVACLADRDGRLPDCDEVTEGALRSRFVARCFRLPSVEFTARVRAVRRRCESRPDALVGSFRGSPLAMTALLGGGTSGRVSWQTWHAYPQTGELVETSSTVAPR